MLVSLSIALLLRPSFITSPNPPVAPGLRGKHRPLQGLLSLLLLRHA